MYVSDAGAVKDLSPELENAYGPIVFSPSLSLTDYSVSVFLNAYGQTSVTVCGNAYVLVQFL